MKKLSKKECDAYYAANGSYHMSDPRHPMNKEKTGASTLKEDPVYKKSGGKIYNCR